MFPAGSPFTVKVTGEGRIKESITRKRQASSIASVGSTCGLNLKIPGERIRRPENARRAVVERFRLNEASAAHTHTPPSVCSPPLPFCRKLVPDGFRSGEANQDVHPEQPHIHSHGAHGDQQDPWRGDQEGGARGGEHPGRRRRRRREPLQRRVRRLSGQREPQQLRRHHRQTRA